MVLDFVFEMDREREDMRRRRSVREKEGGKVKKRNSREKERKLQNTETNSPLDGLLLVRLGVGEAFDGPGLAPEEPAEVGALGRWCAFSFGKERESKR